MHVFVPSSRDWLITLFTVLIGQMKTLVLVLQQNLNALLRVFQSQGNTKTEDKALAGELMSIVRQEFPRCAR